MIKLPINTGYVGCNNYLSVNGCDPGSPSASKHQLGVTALVNDDARSHGGQGALAGMNEVRGRGLQSEMKLQGVPGCQSPKQFLPIRTSETTISARKARRVADVIVLAFKLEHSHGAKDWWIPNKTLAHVH